MGGTEGRTERWTSGNSPCVLQDIGPLGPLPKKDGKKEERGDCHIHFLLTCAPLKAGHVLRAITQNVHTLVTAPICERINILVKKGGMGCRPKWKKKVGGEERYKGKRVRGWKELGLQLFSDEIKVDRIMV